MVNARNSNIPKALEERSLRNQVVGEGSGTRQDTESEEWRAGYARKTVSPRLNPLTAPSRMVPAAEAPHEGTAETAAYPADEEDETAVEGKRAFSPPLPSQPTARELEPLGGANTV